jgi:enoyl-CoA hydratase
MAAPFFKALNDALDQAERDRPIAVVLAGRPGAFSAGLDLKLLPTLTPPDFRDTILRFGEVMLRVFTFPVPCIAAVTGHAIAGGAFLAFACDERYMADGAFKLHVNEVQRAMPLPTWALAIAQNAIPKRFHTEAILQAGRSRRTKRTKRLVDEVVDAGMAMRVPATWPSCWPRLAARLRHLEGAVPPARHRRAAPLVPKEMVGLPVAALRGPAIHVHARASRSAAGNGGRNRSRGHDPSGKATSCCCSRR